MLRFFLFFFSAVLLCSCEKEPKESTVSKVPTPQDTSDLPYQWARPHLDDKLYCMGMEPVSFQDNFIAILASCKDGPLVQAYDKHTGERKWRWNDFVYPGSTVLKDRLVPAGRPEMLLINNHHALYAIDMSDGSTIWKMPKPPESNHIDEGMVIFGKYLYITVVTTVGSGKNGYVFRLKYGSATPVWEEVMKFEGTQSHNPMTHARMAPWIKPSGDSILVVLRHLYRGSSDTKGEIAGYNVSTGSLAFVDSTLSAPGYGVSEDVAVYNNLLIYVKDRSGIEAYNLLTEQVEWIYTPGESVQLAGLAVHDHQLCIKTNSQFVVLDPGSGSTITSYDQEDSEATYAKISFYQDWAFYNGELFIAIDLANNEVVRADITKGGGSSLSSPHNGVVVSASTGQIFLTDQHYAMTLKIEDL